MVVAAAAPAGSDEVLEVLGVLVLVLAAVCIVQFRDARRVKARLREQLPERSHHAGPEERRMTEADKALYEQHKRMNDLTIAKLEAEVALLQAQVKLRGDDEDRIHAAKEAHELTVEKTRLEIDSLRLHIAEMRKRMDDFGLGHD